MPKTIAEMSSWELSDYVQEKEKKHRQEMIHLRALLRVYFDRDEAAQAAAASVEQPKK